MLRRLSSEQGMALPLALGVVLALSIGVFAVLQFTGAGARESRLDAAQQEAKSLAEGGFNRAAAVLWKNYQSNPTSTALPVCTTNCVTGLPSGRNVTWTTPPPTPATGDARVWTVSSTGTVPNPTGPGASPVSRTVSGKFMLGSVPSLDAWKGVYAANQGSDCFMQNSVVVKTPMYVRQSSTSTTTCIKDNGTKYLGSFLAIYGSFVSNDPGATVGQPASSSQPGDPNYPNEFRVPEVHIAGQCSGNPCTESHRVWRCTAGPPCYDNVVPNIPKPAVDYTYWRNNAKPGPGAGNGCDVSSGSVPSFSTTSELNIMGSAFNCEVWEGGSMVGKIQWQPGSSGAAGTLTVFGTIYFSGKLKFENAYGKVSGIGTIYVADSILMDSATTGALCGVVDTTPGKPLCNNSEGPGGWDPGTTTDFLFFVAGNLQGTSAVSVDIKNDYEFQGSVYAVGKFILQNTASFKGPLVAEKLELKNDSTIQGWTPLVTLPSSVPGTTMGLKAVPQSWNG